MLNKEELLKTFNISEKEAIAMKRRYVNSEIKSKEKQKARWFELFYENGSDVNRSFLCLDNIKRLNKEIQTLRFSVKNFYRAKTVDIMAIKRIPIPKLLNYYGIEMKRGIFKLRRDEKTPSCKYYENTNSFYDFGSGKGGSTIDLIMILEDCSVSEAIKTLNNYCG